METTKILLGYAIYLPVAIFLTYYVSRTLFKNSKVYMMDIFKGREEIAIATNKLFETGFYLLNFGVCAHDFGIESISRKLSKSDRTIELQNRRLYHLSRRNAFSKPVFFL